MIVAAGVSYYWAKQGIDERRLQQAKAGSRPTDKLDCKFAVHLTDSDSYLDAFPLIWYFRAGTHWERRRVSQLYRFEWGNADGFGGETEYACPDSRRVEDEKPAVTLGRRNTSLLLISCLPSKALHPWF